MKRRMCLRRGVAGIGGTHGCGARIVVLVLAAAALAACVTVRSDFQPLGEQELLREDFSGGLYAWDMETRDSGRIEQSVKGGRPFLRLDGKGGATVAGSLVDDFRMEFDMRLEAPVVREIAVAMINFATTSTGATA